MNVGTNKTDKAGLMTLFDIDEISFSLLKIPAVFGVIVLRIKSIMCRKEVRLSLK